MSRSFRRIRPGKGETILLSLVTALFVAKESLPALEYLLYPLMAVFFVWSLLLLVNIRKFTTFPSGSLRIYLPVGFVFLLFLLGIMNSDYSVTAFRTEMINLGLVTMMIIMHLVLISSREQFIRYRNDFFRILFYILTIISCFGFVKFWLYLRGIEVPTAFLEEQFSLGTSLILNSDRFIVAIIAAMIGVFLFKFRRKTGFFLALIYHISFLIMFYTVIWTGSKKGLLLMILLFLVMITLRVYFLFHRSRVYNYNLIKNMNIIILIIGFSALLGTWAINYLKGDQKEKWIASLGFDSYHFKSEITMITFAHLSTLFPDSDLQRWYDRLWGQPEPDEQALKDKISFVLIEQENQQLKDDKGAWTIQAIDLRKNRWSESLDLFTTYSTNEKILGRGFRYVDHFSRFPMLKKTFDDISFRNNYLVSSLLYSGLLGVVMLVLLILQALHIYWINRKALIALFSIYLVMVVLHLLSYNTILTNPLLLIALVMPLRYHRLPETNQ